MKWEEYQQQARDKINLWNWKETDIECPNCGEKIFRCATLTLACIPPKYRYKCFNCDWTDVGY